MEFIIHRVSGGNINLISKSPHALSTVTQGSQKITLLAEDVVTLTVESAVKIPFEIGDRLDVFGRVYRMNRLPRMQKNGNRLFTYDIEMEGIQYDLMRASYDLTIDTTSNQLQDVQADSLTGNLRRFADVLISNANRVFQGGWAVGECPATGDKTLAFGESDNCLAVLQRLCQEFDTEFEIEQSGGVNTVNLKKVGQIFPHTFRYGKGNGLYSLERQNVSSANIITRLKVYGASKNITHKYRAHRLCLPGKSKGESYIEKPEAVGMFGVWEATKFFDDEYPKQKGTVTGVFSDSVLKFTDSAMSFDLNEKEADGKTTKYLIAGSAAKVHFNSGNLSGYEFEVSEYDHVSKTFTLKAYKDDRGETFPSTTSTAFQFAVGDEYKLLDIAMPQAIVDAAEASLAAAGEKYYTQNSQPKVQYALDIAEEFLKSLSGSGTVANIVMVGDYVPIQDADIGVDKSVRVQAFSRDLLHPYRYSLTLSDTVTTSITNRVISELIDVEKIISINNLKDPRRSRASWRSSREILSMIFDPEGHYYADKIKPLSIDTIALTVGAKSMQFGLTNTAFHPNYGGNKNVIKVKGGVLTHYTIGSSARSWTLADNTTTFESDSQAYYIYAKCQRTGSAGSVIFSKEQIKAEQDPAYYHFWIGVVNSVDPDIKARTLALMYGFTFISGRYISTGRIQSADGATYFDLDEGVISGNISIMAGSTGYENLTDKPNLTVYKTKAEFNVFANQISGQVSQINTRLGGTETDLNALNSWTTQRIADVNNKIVSANNEISGLKAQASGFITEARFNTLWSSAVDKNGNYIASVITQTPTAINLLSRNIVLTGNTTFNSFKTETQNSLAKKPNKSELGNLAYKSMVSKAQLDSTIIDGGFIKTSLIDVNNLVVNNVAFVGDFKIAGGSLLWKDNPTAVYGNPVGTWLTARGSVRVLSEDRNRFGLFSCYDNTFLLDLRISNANPARFITCDFSAGGSRREFVVEARNTGDADWYKRICIRATVLPHKNAIGNLPAIPNSIHSGSPQFWEVLWDARSGCFCLGQQY